MINLINILDINAFYLILYILLLYIYYYVLLCIIIIVYLLLCILFRTFCSYTMYAYLHNV